MPRVSSVAGTQTSASVSASRPPMKPWPIASSSLSEALVPFIFQLPATSGRMAEVIGRLPSRQRLSTPGSLAKSSDKAIDSGAEGRYCPSIAQSARTKPGCRAQSEPIMLDALRTAAGTWVAKLLLSLLVLSFAIWGISGRMVSGFGASHVIVAGGTTVSLKDYRLAYDRQMQMMSQQFGTRLTREQAAAFGIDQQVLGQLVSGAVLDEQARKLGLGVSKDKLAALAREDPAFRGPDGRFDRRQFDEVLRQVGMTAEDYLRNRQQVAVRQQIVEAISDGLPAPDAFLEAVALYRGEDRTVDYLPLPRSLVEPIEDAGRSGAEGLVRGAQGDIRCSGIPQDRLRQARSRGDRRHDVDQRRAGAEGLRGAYRPLHHARNPQDRAAHLQDARGRQGRLRFDAHRLDLRGSGEGGGQDDRGGAARHVRQGAGAAMRRSPRQRSRSRPTRSARSSTARSARCCCASPKSRPKSSSR